MIPNSATSPYLLSHKDNPVQWRSWGPDALAEARAQDKPVLLSLGYAGCHWCHVMARESFADPEVAAFINENFIPVLVDRDERPDVDMLYQGAAGIMGHPGGWPLNIFLSPDGVPFWVAGYQPKEDKPEIPSFATCRPRDRRPVAERARPRRRHRRQDQGRGGKSLQPRHGPGPGALEPGPVGAARRPALSTSSSAACWASSNSPTRSCWKCCGAPSCAAACRSSARSSSPPWTASCSAASMTISAAASSAMRWTSAGWSPPSRRCSTTRPR